MISWSRRANTTLCFRFLDYGGWTRSQYLRSETIKPRIQTLAEKTNEVAQFSIRENTREIILLRENGTKFSYPHSRLGQRRYLNQTAGGKAILSQLSESELDAIIEIDGLPRAMETTITSREKLLSELDTTRERGYAIAEEERIDGLVAVAVPVVCGESLIGACTVTGPRHRLGVEHIQEETASVLRA